MLCLVAHVAMPWLVLALAGGFAGDERFALTVDYGRIAFPYILLISLTALISGVLNGLGRFAVAAAAPILMNLVMIAFLVIGHLTGSDLGKWQIWSVPAAGVAQLALVWWAAARAGFPIVPRMPRLTPELRRLAIIAGPAVLTAGVVQVNLIVGRQVGSFFDGAVAWLSYADRLYQLPLGVVGVAIGVVLLPDLARRLGAGDHAGGRSALNRAAEFTLALTLPGRAGADRHPRPDRLGAVRARRLRPGRHRRDRARRGDLRRRPAGLRAAEGGAAGLLRPRGHPHAVPLRGARDDRQRRRRARPRAADRLQRRRARHHRRRLDHAARSSGAAPARWARRPPPTTG